MDKEGELSELVEQKEPLKIQVLTNERYFQHAVCPKDNKCILLCADEDCKEQCALICAGQKCPSCPKAHKDCMKIEPEAFLKKLDKKIIRNPKLFKLVNKLVQEATDFISDYEQSIQYYGLNPEERAVYTCAKKGKWQNLKGSDVSKATAHLLDIDKFRSQDDLLQKIQSSWDKSFVVLKNEFQKLSEILRAELEIAQCKSIPRIEFNHHSMIGPGILSKKSNIHKLINLFPKLANNNNCANINILFKASENQFSLDKFYEKCSGRSNTIILIRSQHDKIFGGYTPIPWKKYDKDTTIPDPQNQSFIFSLDSGTKVTMSNSNYAIRFNPADKAINFSGTNGASDLYICQKANVDKKSLIFNANNYGGGGYRSTNYWQQFSGSTVTQFLIKDWECITIQEEKFRSNN